MPLFSCRSIHQGLDPERFSDECRGRGQIYMCLAAVFGDSRINGKSSFIEIVFFIRAFSSSEVSGKHTSSRS